MIEIPLIPFNRPYMTGSELHYIAEAKFANRLAGDGKFAKKVHQWLEGYADCERALLTHSCTAALEMAAMLIDIGPGDEVVMPSYTFVSTANAFVLRGATPVFVDIRPDNLNLDEHLIESAITSRTRAIVPVHYAGVGCEMDTILRIASDYGLEVVEDAAQAVMSCYKGRRLGSIGSLGAFSFHETKNVISGEGGAILVNRRDLVQRAEIIREKGTDRSRFFRGEVDKYTWCDLGSSYLPGEIIAAFLWAQLQEAQQITEQRRTIWNRYHSMLERFEEAQLLRRPLIPSDCEHNAHMYYVLLDSCFDRQKVLGELKARGVHAVSHYTPLHSSAAGRRYGRTASGMKVTDDIADRIVRLPLWIGLSHDQQAHVVRSLEQAINISRKSNPQ